MSQIFEKHIELANNKLKEAKSLIKLLALDFDGVMTDGLVYVDQNGREHVRCSRKDGMGIDLLKKNAIEVCVISTEKNPVVLKRCQKLKIPCTQGIESSDGKGEILKKFVKDKGFNLKEVAYVGDDVNDIVPLKLAGVAITVADGHPVVKQTCHYIASSRGGDHAVREICDLILEAKKVESRY